MVMSPNGLGPKKDSAGNGQQRIQKTDLRILSLTASSNSLWTYGSQLSLYSRSTDRIGNTIPLLMMQNTQKTRHMISRQSIGALTVA
jgi:hypothetical protein